ncbi:MAG: hypothetical protein PVG65_03220 [Candidatus Thorarchaeota archaeon]|jgi:hypothetical protein
MDQERLVTQLTQIIQTVQNYKGQSEMEFEKLQVALTGVLRLLTGEKNSPLTKIQGTSQELSSYIIRQVSELYVNIMDRLENLSSNLNLVLEAVRNP